MGQGDADDERKDMWKLHKGVRDQNEDGRVNEEVIEELSSR